MIERQQSLQALADAPTTRREFTSGDNVAVFVRVYQPDRDSPAAVSLSFTVLNDALGRVVAGESSLAAERFSAGPAETRFKLPLDTLAPGQYVLRAVATRRRAAASRDLRFSVR